MRSCPICNHNGKRVIMNDYMTNEEIPNRCLFECTQCGHRYLDGIGHTQAWYDDYYLNRYTTDDKPFSEARLESLAGCILSYNPDDIIDFGGMDGELTLKVISKKPVPMAVTGVTDEYGFEKYKYGAAVLSHTLEHIYDVPAMMERVKRTLAPCGLLFIEVPIHLEYDEPTEANYHKPYDYKWQHVNKFRPQDLENLLTAHGFKVEVSHQLPDYREYKVYRIVGKYVG